jgi:3-hydroxyisobutyrate dehydrogenase
MATRIIDAGWPTILWARRPEAPKAFDAPNVEIADSPAALAAQSDLVGICVWADDDAREVVAGDAGVLAGCREGTVVALHSTVLPATCRELADMATARGVVVLDAPVTGGRKLALAGALAMAIGGELAALERCKPVFDSFASTVVRLGDVGSGQVAKLLNNTLLAANLALADDALTLGEAFGLDAPALAQLLRCGSGRSYALDVALASRTSAATRRAALPALEKDVHGLAADLAAGGRATSLLCHVAAEAIRRLRDPAPEEMS